MAHIVTSPLCSSAVRTSNRCSDGHGVKSPSTSRNRFCFLHGSTFLTTYFLTLFSINTYTNLELFWYVSFKKLKLPLTFLHEGGSLRLVRLGIP